MHQTQKLGFGLAAVVLAGGAVFWLFGSRAGPVDEEALVRPVDASLFREGALTAPVTKEPCILSEGTRTQCYRLTLGGRPLTHAVGPFCPTHRADSAEKGGVWPVDGQMEDVTGAFVDSLAEVYDDPTWQLITPGTDDVRVTHTREGCEAAARPDVDPAFQNFCVQCSLDDFPELDLVTVLLPVLPVKRSRPVEFGGHGKVGVSLEGVVFDAPAPLHAILGAHTLAPFDDCGGHVNPHTGYHYHAAMGCSHRVQQADNHPELLGYAMDGFGLYAMTDGAEQEPVDLDACRGHEDPVRGYHYHVASPGENMFIGCFMGELGREVR